MVVMIISVILAVGLGLSSIFIQQTKMTRDVGKSVISFYAADSGIEAQLYNIYEDLYFKTGAPDYTSLSSSENQSLTLNEVANSAFASVSVNCGQNVDCSKCPIYFSTSNTICVGRNIVSGCPALNFCLKSIGSYGDSQRVINLKY